jgi:hypothetical protein
MSIPRIAAAGAFTILSAFAEEAQLASRDFASSLKHQTIRAGMQLADVGPHFISSQMDLISSGVTSRA